ncbi:MAG: phosphatidate cytidylyltransferase [Bacteroidales bacterium]|nr:phosphatidate cytidylyltransferase [Bacteroidales bacterium]
MLELVKRTVFGLLYIAVLVAVCLFWPDGMPLLLSLAAYILYHEFYGITLGSSMRACRILVFIGTVAVCWMFWLTRQGKLEDFWFAPAFLPFALLPFVHLLGRDRHDLSKYAWLGGGALYIGLPIAVAPIMIVRGDVYDGLTLLCCFILIWSADVGAYCLGTLLGQKPDSRKLAPSISPKKSWWGVAGGIILSLAAGFVLWFFKWLEMPIWHVLILSFIICACSIAGDLFESALKRMFGVKDSGNLIPGHGGLLDRLDSALLALPVAAVYLISFHLI